MTRLFRARVPAVLVAVLVVVAALAPRPSSAVEVQRVVSPGGIEAWLVQDDMLPILSFAFAFRGGAALDPEGKEGLAALAAVALDEGAGDLDTVAFHDRLDDLSIELGFSAGMDEIRGGVRTLVENSDEAARLLALAVTAARFDPDVVERKRGEMIASLKASERDPGTIASRAWFSRVFPGHPYGRPVRGTAQSIAAVTRDDLVRFRAARLGRDNLVVTAAGNVTPERLGALLDAAFGSLPDSAAGAGLAPAAPRLGGEPVVIFRDIPQSVALFGGRGVTRDDPDFYAAYVMNYILGGGGFSSRLMEEVREKRGLAYAVGTSLHAMDRGAVLLGSAATENARMRDTMSVIRAEWRRLADHGVSAAELANAKAYILGSLALRLRTTSDIADFLLGLKLDDLPMDYIARRHDLIGAVTEDDIRRVAARLLVPDELTVVIVGRPDGYDARPDPAPAADTPASAADMPVPAGSGG